MDETTQRATEILARHCEYMGYPESGQHMMKTHNALEAVKEALSTRPTDPGEDKVEAVARALSRETYPFTNDSEREAWVDAHWRTHEPFARAAIEACYSTRLPTGEDGELVEALERWLAETQMLAFQWMQAHDKLKAGKPYDLPKPADLPDKVATLLSEVGVLRDRVKQLECALEPFAQAWHDPSIRKPAFVVCREITNIDYERARTALQHMGAESAPSLP